MGQEQGGPEIGVQSTGLHPGIAKGQPTNGFAQYYQTSRSTLESLGGKSFERPVFIALSEHDSVLDAYKIRGLFEQRFTHPARG